MSKETTLEFFCPDCDSKVKLEFAVWMQNQLLLVAMCACGRQCNFSADRLTATLIGAVMVVQNGRIQ